jgi:hypothetical protein
MSEVTQILAVIAQSDPHAADRLLPLVYEELRKRAAQKLAQEEPGQNLPGCGGLPSGTAGRAVARCGRDSRPGDLRRFLLPWIPRKKWM